MGASPVWDCGEATLDLGRARVMGVLNVTPDSFSDGGAHEGADEAVAWGMRLLDEGADIIDVGGESTRPGFADVDPAEEARRVIPVVRALARQGALVSIDTRHASVAEQALEAGARIVNDVTGFGDPAMVELAARRPCGCVTMHALPQAFGQPVQATGPARAEGLAGEVAAFLEARMAALEKAGVARERVVADPGVGFGTTADLDMALLGAFGELASGFGHRLVCAVSRKRIVGGLSGIARADERDAASVGVALAAVAAGARIVRAHDVASTAEALRAFEACAGIAPRRQALVALGGNMGDRVGELRSALLAIEALPATTVLAVSDAYETEPAYYDGQPPFVDAVALVSTGLHPMALLGNLLAIEDAAGRVRTMANGPRCVDLDLLWMEGERHAGARLALPHPRIGERDFVLTPLADVVGDARTFCAAQGIACAPEGELVGRVTADLGGLW